MSDSFRWIRFPDCLVNMSLGICYRITSSGALHAVTLSGPSQVFQSQEKILRECASRTEALALLDKMSDEVEAKRYDR